MSATPSEPTPTPQPEPTPEPQGDPAADTGDKPLGENGEKALKAERDRATKAEKANAALQKQLDDIAAANLSDLEKAQKLATDAQAAAQVAATEAMRYRIAAEASIVENVDLILTAPDEETMRKQAANWNARASGTTPGPRPDLSQGGKGGTATGTPEQDFANFIGRQLAG